MITTTIFPSRYVQGPDALHLLGEEAERFGNKVLLLQSPSSAKTYNSILKEQLRNFEVYDEIFNRECCDEEIDRLIGIAKIDMVIGIGGGKTQDTAKAVAYRLNIPVIIIPTLASSDAPCSALSVIYTKEGSFKRYEILKSNPNLVLVDSNIIAKAPVRLLVAGMGDALATWFEAESCSIARSRNLPGRLGSATALGLARMCYETLLEYGVFAIQSCKAQVTSPALERVIEANTLLSGLGFESGGLAAAHAIHNGLTVLEPTHNYWHGEKVAIGTLASLILTDKDEETIDIVFSFCESVGLPTTLAEIGLTDVSDAELMQVATAATAEGETIHNESAIITAEAVFNAIKTANTIGLARKAR